MTAMRFEDKSGDFGIMYSLVLSSGGEVAPSWHQPRHSVLGPSSSPEGLKQSTASAP